MTKKIVPVDKHELRNKLIDIPGVWICKVGYCIPIKDLNNAIDDLNGLSKSKLLDYIFEQAKGDPYDPKKDDYLNTLLTINEVRKYIGLEPLPEDEYLEVGHVV